MKLTGFGNHRHDRAFRSERLMWAVFRIRNIIDNQYISAILAIKHMLIEMPKQDCIN